MIHEQPAAKSNPVGDPRAAARLADRERTRASTRTGLSMHMLKTSWPLNERVERIGRIATISFTFPPLVGCRFDLLRRRRLVFLSCLVLLGPRRARTKYAARCELV